MALAVVLTSAAQRQGNVRAIVPMDTLNEVVIVRNGRSGLWRRGEAWTAKEIFRLGGPDGPAEVLFSGPLTSVSIGPHGHLYVLDSQAADIRIFDGEGHFLRLIGGRGQGPGELAAPSALGWDEWHRLWVANGFNGRYTLFDSTGAFIKTVPRALHALARPQHQMLFDRADSFVDETAAGLEIRLLRVDTTGNVIDTLTRLRHPRRPSGGNAPLPQGLDRSAFLYLPRLVWTLAPNGTIWSAESGRLRLVQQALDGDTIRIVETQHRRVNLDRREVQRVERELSKAGLDRSQYSLARPLVQSLLVMRDGHILVQIADEPGQPGRALDVFDPLGQFLGTIRLPVRVTTLGLPAMVADTMVAVAIGEMDVPYVIRLTLERPRR